MRIWKWIFYSCAIFLLPNFAKAQNVDEVSVRAALVLNFIENTYWPESSNRDNLYLLMYGADTALYNQLQQQFLGIKYHNRQVIPKKASQIDQLITADIIFVTSSKSNDLDKIYNLVVGKPVLVISEYAPYGDKSIVNIIKKSSKISFQINPLNLIRQGLRFDKQLLIYADNLMDYPDQFVEIEKDLALQKAKISEQEKIITKKEEDTKILEERNSEMASLMNSYRNTITEQEIQINEQELQIDQGMNILDSLNVLLIENQKVLDGFQDSIRANNLWMSRQKGEIKVHEEKISQQLLTLESQQELLDSLDSQVKIQKQSIEQQESIIDRQTNLLILFSVLVIVIIVLGVLTYNGFEKNRKARKILKQQNNEIALSEEILQKQTVKLQQAKDQIEEYNNRLEEINSNLEMQVQERTKHLTKTNQELDHFVYSVSHDIKAPLASIMGIVNLMKYEKPAGVVSEYTSRIEKSVNKLNLFISEVLEFSRNARTEIRKDEVDLEKLIYSIFDELKYLQDGTKTNLKVEFDSVETFYTDRARLTVVLKNIISNSLKYCDSDKESCEIEIHGSITDYECMVTISDNGQGIAKEHIDKIYDMFYRANEFSEGSGLGLYIVKETLEKIQGRIKVKSKIGQGTTVELQLKNLNTYQLESSEIST